MKAAVLNESGLQLEDVPKPPVEKDWVRVRIHYCGICGSDIPRVCKKTAHTIPIILGHEFSGAIDEVGSEVKNFVKGDRVVCIPLVPCYACEACLNGAYSLCSNYKFIGTRLNGGYAEFVSVPSKNVLKIPKDLSFLSAALIEPCSVARHAFNFIEVSNKSVCIVGSGIIGLFSVQWAKILGAKHITLMTHNEKNYDPTVLGVDEIMIFSEKRGYFAEIIIDCAGTPQSISQILTSCKPRSTIIFVGTPTSDVNLSVTIWEQINRKELTIYGSWMSYSAPFPGIEWTESIKYFQLKKININKYMISKVCNLSELNEIFDEINILKKKGRVLIKM